MFCDEVKRAHRGPCRNCDCPDIVSPVCAENGHSYVNSCEANCHGAIIIGEGRCDGGNIGTQIPDDNVCSCPDDYAPVCA